MPPDLRLPSGDPTLASFLAELTLMVDQYPELANAMLLTPTTEDKLEPIQGFHLMRFEGSDGSLGCQIYFLNQGDINLNNPQTDAVS